MRAGGEDLLGEGEFLNAETLSDGTASSNARTNNVYNTALAARETAKPRESRKTS